MYANLPHVRVTTVLVVADHSHLDHESSNRILADVFDGNDDPPGGLAEVDYFDFVEIVEVSAAADRDS